MGAEVDISSADILVADGAGISAQPGQIVITPSSLDALGAQTLLIGGLRNDGVIDTTAQAVEIASGATVEAPQVLLTAQDQVTLDPGASIVAKGTAPPAGTYTLSGDGAFLGVSAGEQNSVTRIGAIGATGVLTLASGSSIAAAAGAIYLDATQNIFNSGTLAVAGGDLAVQAPSIGIGAVPVVPRLRRLAITFSAARACVTCFLKVVPPSISTGLSMSAPRTSRSTRRGFRVSGQRRMYPPCLPPALWRSVTPRALRSLVQAQALAHSL